MIYFTSDLHFYHDNIIKYCNRPFENSDVMNQKLVQNWNKTVNANDEVYILGDFTLKGAELANESLAQLKGRKNLIIGNHDNFITQTRFETHLFEKIKDYHKIKYNNEVFILSHYPFLEWDMSRRGSIHLHGHQHNQAEYNEKNQHDNIKRFDVGVDANNFTPVSIDYIIDFFS